MPELPFLEILTENLAPRIAGRRIEAFEVRQPALLQRAAPEPASFIGEYLSTPSRIGKYLVIETESRRAIVIHLMRLGRITVAKKAAAPPRNVSARIRLDDGSELRLLEHGTEKRARLWLADDLDSVTELRDIGPDPSRGEPSLEGFTGSARAASRQLKTFLTDQSALGGIGNGLADEILFAARLSPLQRTDNLNEEEIRRLYDSLHEVVRRQTELLRASARGELPQKEPVEHYAVHDRKGEPCPRCSTPIAWISFADRDTFYCPGCQSRGIPLKDRRLSKLLK